MPSHSLHNTVKRLFFPALAIAVSTQAVSADEKPAAKPQAEAPAAAKIPDAKARFYMTHLDRLRGKERFYFAAAIPTHMNQAKALMDQREKLELKLIDLSSNGLAERHPRYKGVLNQLAALDAEAETAAVMSVIAQLNNEAPLITPDSVKQRRINKLKTQLEEFLAQGLGDRHPRVLHLKRKLSELTPKEEKAEK